MIQFILAMLISAAPPVSNPEAAKAFEDLVDTVRSGDTVRIESNLQLEARIGNVIESAQPAASVYVLGGPGRGMLRTNGWIWRVAGDHVLIEHEDDDTAYVRQPLTTSAMDVFRGIFTSVPDPYLAMVMGDEDARDVISNLHDGSLGLVPVAVEEEGRRVRLAGPDATLVFDIDLIGRPESAILDVSDREGSAPIVRQRWTWTWSHASLTREEADAALRFERNGRHRVDSVHVLQRQRVSDREAADPSSREVGAAAPPLALEDETGGLIQLAMFRGRIVVIDFWASWCGSCMRGLPQLQLLADQWAASELPVQVLTVNTMERIEEGESAGARRLEIIKQVRKNHALTLPVLIDVGGKVARSWNVTGLPTTFVVDAEGRLVKEFRGVDPHGTDGLEAAVQQALKQSAPSEGGQ